MVGCGGSSASNATASLPSSITVAPTQVALAAGSGLQFAGTTNNNTGVTWQVNGIAGGNSTVGTISSSGLYNAPPLLPNGPITVTAAAQLAPSLTASASVTVTNTNTNHDTLGNVSSSNTVSCTDVGADSGVAGSTCYQLNVSCPDVSDETVDLKVNTAPVPLGTVLFTAGGGGLTWYDQEFTHGADAINQVIAANFTTVQMVFETPPGFPSNLTPAGWLSGPGGVRKLACRWATAAKWVHDNMLASNTAFCSTGNSGASGAMGYAISQYGMEATFNFLEMTSGPPMARIDQGCLCNTTPVSTPCGQTLSACYQVDANMFLDPAYASTICSSAETTHSTSNQDTFINDSVLSPDANLVFPDVNIHFVFGGRDTGSAPPQAMQWMQAISAKGPISGECVADAPHALADALDGANKIANDVIAMCHR
jgi:hypothetical protein